MIVLGIVLGVLVALAVCYWVLHPYVFRLFVLPVMGRRRGWRTKYSMLYWLPQRDLPGDGSQSWEAPLPATTCEFLGMYGGRPVHGVEVTQRWFQKYELHLPGNASVRRFTVITMATSDRPFGGFNAPHRGPVMNGDPMAFYPDFLEWARNRRVPDLKGVVEEGQGLRSLSWRGWMTRKKVLAALDRLTAQTAA